MQTSGSLYLAGLNVDLNLNFSINVLSTKGVGDCCKYSNSQ